MTLPNQNTVNENIYVSLNTDTLTIIILFMGYNICVVGTQ